MDTTKHTVTIPISDYNELSNNESSEVNALRHFELLVKEGINFIGDIDVKKRPIGAVASYISGASGIRASVKFIY